MRCPKCGKGEILSTVRVDYCSNDDCDYGEYYPDGTVWEESQ